MNKKHLLFGIILLMSGASFLQAQDVQAKLDEARSAYASGNLENTRFALEEALNGINQAIGNEILALLPATLNGMAVQEGQDQVTGTNLGFAGLYVNRYYGNEERNASVEIVSDSPLLAGINSLLALPVIMNNDPNQKRIKLGNYKALMTRNTDETGRVSWDIQMPFGSSLLTFTCAGFDNENEVTGMAGSLPMEKIVQLAQ